MELTSPNIIKKLLSKYETKPSKKMGQNFLVDQEVLIKIIETASLTDQDVVLEVGPGIGTLTYQLAKKAKRVVAIEKDKIMIEILKETLKDCKNVEIIQDNALRFNPNSQHLTPNNYKVAANIPYYLTSPLIRMFLESENKPSQIVLMVQKEVAQRICAKPPNMNLLAVSVQFYAKPAIAFYVPKECFWPKPKVDSAILKISDIKDPSLKVSLGKADGQMSKLYVKKFFKIVKAGFSQKRKQLSNNLSEFLKINKEDANEWLKKNNIRPEQRAETLDINDWINLTQDY